MLWHPRRSWSTQAFWSNIWLREFYVFPEFHKLAYFRKLFQSSESSCINGSARSIRNSVSFDTFKNIESYASPITEVPIAPNLGKIWSYQMIWKLAEFSGDFVVPKFTIFRKFLMTRKLMAVASVSQGFSSSWIFRNFYCARCWDGSCLLCFELSKFSISFCFFMICCVWKQLSSS